MIDVAGNDKFMTKISIWIKLAVKLVDRVLCCHGNNVFFVFCVAQIGLKASGMKKKKNYNHSGSQNEHRIKKHFEWNPVQPSISELTAQLN